MAEYADIAELDQDAFDIRHSWNVTMKHASSFAWRFRAIQERFISGKFGPEWTFARWLVAKCGMSLRTCYRVIRDLERTANDDDRRRTQDALAEIYKQQAQEKAGLRARKLAWNDWLLEEKNRKIATQAAWDEWRELEKLRAAVERDAKKQAKAAERKKEAQRAAQKRYRDNVKAKKAQQNNTIESVMLSQDENEKPLPSLSTVLDDLGAMIRAMPPPVRRAACRQLAAWLMQLADEPVVEAA